jgi:hypothetical protein
MCFMTVSLFDSTPEPHSYRLGGERRGGCSTHLGDHLIPSDHGLAIGAHVAADGMMTDRTKSGAQAERERRLEAALRENLKRRKAQARGRAESQHDKPAEPHDSAGIAADKENR